MDPINPWLDPAEVRRLAERLMTPAREPEVKLPDAGFGETFIGFTTQPEPVRETPREPIAAQTPPPVQTPVPMTAAIPAPASPPPPLAPEADDINPAPASGARSPFLDRIHRFDAWMSRHFGASGIFILDRDGAVIFDEAGHGKLHFLARSLAQATRQPGADAENVHVKIGAASTLEVIPVDTPYGCLVLGAIVPEVLDPEAVARVRSALILAATPPGA